MPRLRPTGSALRQPSSITASYFSSSPSDSTSRQTPCPPGFPGPRFVTPGFGYESPHPKLSGTLTHLTALLPCTHYGLLRLPHRPAGTSSPYIRRLPPEGIGTGLPCSLSYGFSYVSLSPREFHLSVMVVFVKIDASLFPFVRQGRQLCFIVTRLHPGLLSLRPVGLLSSLSEPLSRNLVLQVTLHTSFKLRG